MRIAQFRFYVFGVFWVGFTAYVAVIPVTIVERLLRIKNARLSHTILHRSIAWGGMPEPKTVKRSNRLHSKNA